MEKNQLNLNLPLLSVRRFSSGASQDGDKENTKQRRWDSLPPCKADFELGEVTKPAAVPFMWEQIPGRPKVGTSAQSQSPKEPSWLADVVKQFSKVVSEDHNVIRPHTKASSLKDNANKGVNGNRDSDSQSEDEAFSDARDTLSPPESNSFSCSFSSLSGYDDGPEVKPSGSFSTDPQTRDFMMSRFLPAAKAMVLTTPQCVPRKEPLESEQPKQVKNVATEETWALLQRYKSIMIPCEGQYEETDDEDADSGCTAAKACGLFPRFFLKNSLGLVNPMPAMKERTRTAMSSSTEASRLTRTGYNRPPSLIVDKDAWNAGHKTHVSVVQSHELLEVENKLIGMTDELYTYKSPKDRVISPYRNVAPQSIFREGTGFLGVPKVVDNDNTKPKSYKPRVKGSKNFQDVPSPQGYKQGSCPVSPLTRHTFDVDSVNTAKFISSQGIGPMGSTGEVFVTLEDRKGMEGNSEGKASVFSNGDLFASFHKSDVKQAKGTERLRSEQSVNQEPWSLDNLEFSKVHINRNQDMASEHKPKIDLENSIAGSFQSPLPPPLPKSPSESWLCRALPCVSSQNSFSNLRSSSQFYPTKQCTDSSSDGTKWETIVKTSNFHSYHELDPCVSKHFKT